MKSFTVLLLGLTTFSEVLGNANFVSNPTLPYPPACAFSGQEELTSFVENLDFRLTDINSREPVELKLSSYRSSCSEPNRSLIWIEITAPENRSLPFTVALPDVWARSDGDFLMNLASAPSGWGVNSDPILNQTLLVYDPDRHSPSDDPPRWLFLLDNADPRNVYGFTGLTPDQYNGAFQLELGDPSHATGLGLDIPSTQSMELAVSPLPISGRLSGNWVIEGAADQGLVLAVSDRVDVHDIHGEKRHSPTMVVFLAHYTFDAEGGLLWLTGAADVNAGATSVSIPIERVVNGDFMGNRTADREIVGSVQLTVRSCNDILFEFDYDGLGLGSGSEQLARLFSLETAGYDCRDYSARVSENN